MSARDRKPYAVSLPDYIVFAKDETDAVDEALAIVQDGALHIERLTTETLREYGDEIPAVQWDPDRELTCAEIADEMEKAVRS